MAKYMLSVIYRKEIGMVKYMLSVIYRKEISMTKYMLSVIYRKEISMSFKSYSRSVHLVTLDKRLIPAHLLSLQLIDTR